MRLPGDVLILGSIMQVFSYFQVKVIIRVEGAGYTVRGGC